MSGRLLAILLLTTISLPIAACGSQGRTPAGSKAQSATSVSPTEAASNFDTSATPTGEASGSPLPSPTLPPCTVAPPSSQAALISGGSLPAGASSAPASALVVAFSRSVADPSVHFIRLVGVDGRVVATAKANNRSAISGTCGNDVEPNQVYPSMPLVSTSAGRVYHLDGDTDVRFLAPNGASGLAFKVPGGSHAVAMFSVSPDDRMIAVSVLNYVTKPVSDRIYVEDIAGGGHHIELAAPQSTYLWPAGWHAGKLIMGVVTATPSFGFYAPIPRITAYELLEPETGKAVTTLDGECAPLDSLPSPAGVACRTSRGAVGVIDWTGASQVWASGDSFTGGASLSIDGATLAASGQGAILRLIRSPSSGGDVSSVGGGYPGDGGWIDRTHLVLRGGCCESILDISAARLAPLPPDAVLAGRLPGGL
jgi:hypothetical protein